MRKALLLLCLLPVGLFGQGGVRYDNFTFTTANSSTRPPVLAIPSASITVCGYPATGGVPCTNTVTVYSNQGLTIPISPLVSDAVGNFGFWIAAGCYSYTVTGTGLTGSTYSFCVGSTSATFVNATQFTGGDILAQAQAAAASCSSDDCTVEIPAGTYNSTATTFNYPIVSGGNFRLVIDAGAVLNYTGTGCAISAVAGAPTNANNIRIYNYGQIVGTAAGKAGICLGAANAVVIWAGDISGFTNTGAGSANRGLGSGIYNDGANTVDIYGANLRGNRYGFYCTAALNTPAGGWFGCNANHFHGGHIQSNTEWGVVVNGEAGPDAGVNVKLTQNTFESVIEGNANGVTPASCSIVSWARNNVTNLTTVTCTAPHSFGAGQFVVLAGAVAGGGGTTPNNGAAYEVLPTGLTATAFVVTGLGGAADTGGAGGTATLQVGGLLATNAPALTVHSYFELNGSQQDIIYEDVSGYDNAGVISQSTFAGTATTNGIRVNGSNVTIDSNYLGPNPGYTNLVSIPVVTGATGLANLRVRYNSIPSSASAALLAMDGGGSWQGLNPTYTWDIRDINGNIVQGPKWRPYSNTANQFSPFFKLCGLDGSSAEICGDISSYQGTIILNSLSKGSTYTYGYLNAIKTIFAPNIIAGSPAASTGLVNLTAGNTGGLIVFSVASTAAIGPVGTSRSGVTAGVCVLNTAYNGSYQLQVYSATIYYITPTGSEPAGCGAATPGTTAVGGAGSGAPSQFQSGITTGQSGNSDLAGQCTLGTNCTITFVNTYATAPICVATDTTAAAATKVVTNTTTLTITGTGTDVINYVCVGRT